MTPVQRDLARHALGLDGRRKESYRNYFVTGEGSTDHPHWLAMVEAGYATRRSGSILTGGDDFFRLTRAGADLALDPGESLNTVEFSPVQPQKDTTA
ncbi:MAG: hypothetical protein E5V67_22815 [Mesorhizobium sp.]|uniref:hypothetical protein n=1 Tax=Mesorhizobium sp. M00.F.Ca.ET.217.01.1.1 TaxID=2500529 RepID=UPI000FD95A60|nr:hypothetical protein [Mesorhizobium sp. M00.F.Ca.ET.217.01.1.1]TGQ19150.1 hypothetical protein EN860_022180 [Mesorhizobium sp. M00.F.Ca.ET.217.01.1.1]TGV90057.1 hypothetical protein EN801_020605 [Mesorhizobium sp. M00.F.Ca.ET.158.01.1.1]TKB32147.1 MAG: hypothetical protein E5V67_22815 [Mesorhizobium sp.]